MQFLFKELAREVVLFQGSMFLPACSIPSLVRRKWSKILYLGATFALTLVEDTPGLTEDVRMLIFPTKSSEEKVQCVSGFKNFAFSTKC